MGPIFIIDWWILVRRRNSTAKNSKNTCFHENFQLSALAPLIILNKKTKKRFLENGFKFTKIVLILSLIAWCGREACTTFGHFRSIFDSFWAISVLEMNLIYRHVTLSDSMLSSASNKCYKLKICDA